MNALIMMLLNTLTNTYHPIFYIENMFPGPFSSSEGLIRYKSKGHRTVGFKNREEAIASIETELCVELRRQGYIINLELDGDLTWDGKDVPADNQIRKREIESPKDWLAN
jgi:hypothetical protein